MPVDRGLATDWARERAADACAGICAAMAAASLWSSLPPCCGRVGPDGTDLAAELIHDWPEPEDDSALCGERRGFGGSGNGMHWISRTFWTAG